ncbi:MAG: T9SS type A sorting domain-containing protein [Lewinellaceae bacterium]|nr:T9SS type A sorting domain-containing protein [Lewinellaceae bacterium]
MKATSKISILTLSLFSLLYCSRIERETMPVPTDGTMVKMGEEEEGEEIGKRDAWLELIHSAGPGVNWRQIEYDNRLAKVRARLDGSRGDCTGGSEVFAEGAFSGQWLERGSINNAGSVFDTEYDPDADMIWLVSAGGTIWNSDAFGSTWQVVNQDYQFSPGVLKFVPHDGARRLLALADRIPHYSDDDGQTWTAATGIQHTDGWGNVYSPVVLTGDDHDWYLFAKPSYWEQVKLYKSADLGENFQPIKTMYSHEFERFALCQPHHSQKLYLAEKDDDNKAKFYRMDLAADTLIPLPTASDLYFNEARTNLIGWQDPDNGDLRLLCYVRDGDVNTVYRSDDEGLHWNELGDLPEGPWEVGVFISPSNPDLMLMGAVDCFRSLDGGLNWQRVNNWWEYYDNINGKLHADMMHFSEFQTPNGTAFQLISNHGGLNISYDGMNSVNNLGQEGLNVSQYYTVRTDPTNPDFVYAGSQDQGFQRSAGFETGQPGSEWFEQVISGDYAHIVFSNGGASLWTVYPGGWVSHYADPQNQYLTGSYDLESENESVWLPPLMPSPFSGENAVYMAGGNIEGGPGSYLIRLEAQGDQVIPSQIDYDFKAESGGEVSALATAPGDSSRWYVATTNGRFFYSKDAGESWEQTLNFIPEGHYLYGQAIYVSKKNPNVVYFGGSGYSNSPVYRSLNGGKNFLPVSFGLPATTVFELAANEDESMIFAATEAGPYVYVLAKNHWYDLSGSCAPTQTYWSVEYLEASRTVRFGTYGRGIWDFQFDPDVATNDKPELAPVGLNVSPNPTSGAFRLEVNRVGERPLPAMLYDAGGKLVKKWSFQAVPGAPFAKDLDIAELPSGIYYITVENDGRKESAKLIKQ